MKKIVLSLIILSVFGFSSIAQTWTTSAALEGNMPTGWTYDFNGGGVWGGDLWLNNTGYVEFSFSGTQVRINGITTPSSEIVNVGVDGTADIYIDGILVEDNFTGFIGATEVGGVLIYTSPTLANAAHTIRVKLNGYQLGINSFEYLTILTSIAANTTMDKKLNAVYNSDSKEVKINSSSLVSVSVYNMAGQVMPTTYSNNRISVSNLNKGIYILKAMDLSGNFIGSQKLVIY